MKKTILPLLCAAVLTACDHYDRTDGHATVIGHSIYSGYYSQPHGREVQPAVRRVAPKPVPPAPRVAAPRPAPAPAPVAVPPPPAPKPAPAVRPAPPRPTPAPAVQPAPKPKYAVMPGQNRGLRIRR